MNGPGQAWDAVADGMAREIAGAHLEVDADLLLLLLALGARRFCRQLLVGGVDAVAKRGHEVAAVGFTKDVEGVGGEARVGLEEGLCLCCEGWWWWLRRV